MMQEHNDLLATNLHPEEKLLLCCARTEMDIDNAERIIALLQENIDWGYLLQMALNHNLVPLLHRSLEVVTPDSMPKRIREELRKEIMVNVQNNLFLTKELLHLLDIFNRHSIQVLPYKGPVLAASLYGDLALRPSGDLDILVQEQDVLQATNVLIFCGYEIIRPSIVSQTGRILQQQRINELVERSPWAYQLVLSHPERQGLVELHWRITPRYVFPKSPEQLWQNLIPVRVGGITVRSFAPENLLWFLCVHGSKHQWKRLSWLCDIAELIRVYPDLNWGEVIAQAAKLGITRRLNLGLLLASCLLGAPLPRAVERKIHNTPHVNVLAQNAMKKIFDDTTQTDRIPYLERFAFQLRAMDHLTDRGRYLLRFATGLTARLMANELP